MNTETATKETAGKMFTNNDMMVNGDNEEVRGNANKEGEELNMEAQNATYENYRYP